MAYSKSSLYIDVDIRKMIGRACYVEVAMCKSEWEKAKLEELIINKVYPDQTGLFQRMVRGILPNEKTLARIECSRQSSEPKCLVRQWREAKFWEVFNSKKLSDDKVLSTIKSFKSPVKKIMWSKNTGIPARNVLEGNKELRKIRDYYHRESLITLLIVAREGIQTEQVRKYYYAASLCSQIFPEVMMNSPHLYISWRILAIRLMELIWQPENYFHLDKMQVDIRFPNILNELKNRIDELDASTRDKSIWLPPKHIIDQYNAIA